MDDVVKFCTQKWPFGPEACITAFALFHSARIRKLEKAGGKELFWAESLILTFFMAFGGGIVAPFLLGKPPIFFVNDLLVPLVALSWFLSNRMESLVRALLDAPLIKQVVVVLAECARANATCTMVATAMGSLKASKYYPIPLWGPVLLGTIAGCGGLFLPLDKGLKGVKDGAPWPMQSAFYGSFFFHIMVHDPNIGPYLREWAGEVIEEQPAVAARVLVVLFFCACGVGQTIFGPSFNPLSPAHDVLYRVTGVPTPGVVAARAREAAGQGKAKEE